MGFLSWKTADTQENINHIHSGAEVKTVYLLNPAGFPIREDAYEGFGRFGEVDAYEFLFDLNAKFLGLESLELDSLTKSSLGLELAEGEIILDTNTNEYWHIFGSTPLVEGNIFEGNFANVIPNYKKSANQLLNEGIFKSILYKDLLKYPFDLKFSFYEDAKYHSLKASEVSPSQGY